MVTFKHVKGAYWGHQKKLLDVFHLLGSFLNKNKGKIQSSDSSIHWGTNEVDMVGWWQRDGGEWEGTSCSNCWVYLLLIISVKEHQLLFRNMCYHFRLNFQLKKMVSEAFRMHRVALCLGNGYTFIYPSLSPTILHWLKSKDL